MFNLFKIETIKQKITALMLVIGVVLVLVLSSYFYITNLNENEEQIVAKSFVVAENISQALQAQVNKQLTVSSTLAQGLAVSKSLGQQKKLSRRNVNEQLKTTLTQTDGALAISLVWEKNAFDGIDSLYANTEGHDSTGRFTPLWIKDNDGTTYLEALSGYLTNEQGDFYLTPRRTRREHITSPYSYPVFGDKRQIITFSVPIMHDYQYFGVVGVSSDAQFVQTIIEGKQIFEIQPTIEIIDANGILLGVSNDRDKRFQPFENLHKDWEQKLEYIKTGKNLIQHVDSTDELQILIPFKVGQSRNNWAICIRIPEQSINSYSRSTFVNIFFISLILIIVGISIIAAFINYLIRPLDKIADFAEEVARGEIRVYSKLKTTGTEITRLYQALIKIIKGLADKSEFARNIGQGNFEAPYKPLSEHDNLGNSLLEMRENLKKAQQTEIERKEEEKRQNWTTIGLAKFNEILRTETGDIQKMSYQIISNLVQYLSANQGGVFLYIENEDGDKYLELNAAYAYNRRKFINRRIKLGEGLLGAVAIEKNTYYFEEVPEKYIRITSGLGNATPNNLLIVPLVLENVIFGVVEIASFYSIAEHQRKFVERLAENIASTLNATRINQRTKMLLEQSRRQSEEMAAQEEEMRQNLEELQATQEESARRQMEMEGIIKALHSSYLVYELDLYGKFISISDSFTEFISLKSEKLIDKRHNQVFRDLASDQHRYNQFWNDLRDGVTRKVRHYLDTDKGQAWLSEIYTPILDINNSPYKVLVIGTEITESLNKEKEIQKLLKESQEQTRRLSDQEEEMRRNLEELMRVQHDIEQQNRELENANKVMQEKETSLHEAFKRSKRKSRLLKKNHERMKRAIKKLKTAQAELQAQKQALEEQKNELESKNSELRLNDLRLQRSFKKSKAKSDRLDELEKQMLELQDKLKQLEDENRRLKDGQ